MVTGAVFDIYRPAMAPLILTREVRLFVSSLLEAGTGIGGQERASATTLESPLTCLRVKGEG